MTLIDDKKVDGIRKRILSTGFPTEIEISNILRKKGWLVGNQWPYVDRQTKKIRPVDVLALRVGLPRSNLGFLLLIECKKGSKDWVFYSQEKTKDFLPFMGTLADFVRKIGSAPTLNIFLNMSANAIMASKMARLHLLDSSIRIGVLNAGKGAADFQTALKQLLSAVGSMRDSVKSFWVFPLIIFDGELYEFCQENDETKVWTSSHLQFISYEENMMPCLIDVVKKEYFPRFLDLLEQDFVLASELMANGRPQ